jgi:putative transcriptional regulator
MSKPVVFASIRPDGTLALMTSDGNEEALPGKPIAAITPEQAKEATHQEPDTPLPGTENSRLAPHVATLRGALALTQEEFASRYQIPLGTLCDWEQGRSEPDQPMCAYLTVIARHPEVVRRTIQRRARAVRSRGPTSRGQQAKAPRASITDAEARAMKLADGGFRPAYNMPIVSAPRPR